MVKNGVAIFTHNMLFPIRDLETGDSAVAYFTQAGRNHSVPLMPQ